MKGYVLPTMQQDLSLEWWSATSKLSINQVLFQIRSRPSPADIDTVVSFTARTAFLITNDCSKIMMARDNGGK